MASYNPTPRQLGEDLELYLRRELDAISAALRGTDVTEILTVLYRPPVRFKEGRVVFADGVHWNPGQGRGVYVFTNGQWEKA